MRIGRGCQLLRVYVYRVQVDFDNLDDDAVAHTNLEHGIRQGDLHREQPMPLLFGPLDASGVKRSLDIPMGVYSPEYSDVDPDELSAEREAEG